MLEIRTQSRKVRLYFFSSKNLEKWKFETVLAENSTGQIGTMWECPDFFELDGTHFLICSPQNMKAQKYEFHNGNNSVYFSGKYNETEHTFQKEAPKSLDYGLDFYVAADDKTSGWTSDSNRLDEVMGCLCDSGWSKVAGNDDTAERTAVYEWKIISKSGGRTEAVS